MAFTINRRQFTNPIPLTMICVVSGGQIRITQRYWQEYGQEYKDTQLRELHRFISNPMNIATLEAGLENIKPVNKKEGRKEHLRILTRFNECFFTGPDPYELFKEFIKNPCSDTLQPVLQTESKISLSQLIGAGILTIVACSVTEEKVPVLAMDKGTRLEPPIYVVNLDKRRLEFYYGYTKKRKSHIFTYYSRHGLVPCNTRRFSFSRLRNMDVKHFSQLAGFNLRSKENLPDAARTRC